MAIHVLHVSTPSQAPNTQTVEQPVALSPCFNFPARTFNSIAAIPAIWPRAACDFHAHTSPLGHSPRRWNRTVHAAGRAPSETRSLCVSSQSLHGSVWQPPGPAPLTVGRDSPDRAQVTRKASAPNLGSSQPFRRAWRPFRPSCGHSQALALPRPAPLRLPLHNQPQHFHSKFRRWQRWQVGGSTICHLFLLLFQ